MTQIVYQALFRAYGFHSADALSALAMLTVGGLRPALPGRTWNPRIR